MTNTTLSEALSHCPTATPGCVIDMRANSSPTALNLGVFDPGATPVVILLGPYGYKGALTAEPFNRFGFQPGFYYDHADGRLDSNICASDERFLSRNRCSRRAHRMDDSEPDGRQYVDAIQFCITADGQLHTSTRLPGQQSRRWYMVFEL